MPPIQVIIDDSTDKTIAGTYYFDRDNGGTFIGGAGTSFPGSPVAGEWFWRSDEDKLYRRNNGNDAWDTVVAGVGAHASTHENGGADEVSVAGLSGELADDQPPKTHALGTAHSTDTLANLNAKVTDATLIDTGDSRLSNARTPTSHASSHQNAGGDEISVAGLSGELTDDQPPKTHALGIAHSTDTLANLNAKVTDATLDDSSDPRTDDDAIHDDVTGEINAITAKSSLVGNDVFLIEDSAASYAKKKVTAANLPGGVDTTAIHKATAAEISVITAKATPIAADLLLIEDSAAANAKKSIQAGNLPFIPQIGTVLDQEVVRFNGTSGDAVEGVGVRNYGASATDPSSPTPQAGDTYYNTAINQQMVYDGTRSKWLSVAMTWDGAGRNGTVGAGTFYRRFNGMLTANAIGGYVLKGTIVGVTYATSTAVTHTLDVKVGGSVVVSAASAGAATYENMGLDIDISAGVMAYQNQAGSATTTHLQCTVFYKLRV